MKVSVEKPGSPEDILVHYGKKGMKWGVRTESQRVTPRQATKAGGRAAKAKYRQERDAGAGHFQARSAAKREKVTVARNIHKEARAANPNVAASRSFSQKFPTGKTRAAEIHRARTATEARRTAVILETNPTKRAKLAKEFDSHPDRAIALRYTRGEKTVMGIIAGALAAPVAVVGVAGAPVAAGGALGIGVGTTAVRATRRHIERKQARGGYG